ncbi:MAG TPA: sulfatase/phosphatase domain-containing protein, partial [Gaiellaceae bacterium]|nr:sulfatase/phosphatase domain-containing protein [Gaiellaceae bacterium]
KSEEIRSNASFHAAIRADELRQLPTIDDVVGSIVDVIAREGLQPRTWGIFTSDNGRLWGEHRLGGKVYAYEESIRVPFRMMIPESPASTIDALVANIDVAPTLAALAGDKLRHSFDGQSLLPLLEDRRASWRTGVLVEHFGPGRRFDGFRNARWTYVLWPSTGHEELYDRRRDPYQLTNIAGREVGVAARLRERTEILTGS